MKSISLQQHCLSGHSQAQARPRRMQEGLLARLNATQAVSSVHHLTAATRRAEDHLTQFIQALSFTDLHLTVTAWRARSRLAPLMQRKLRQLTLSRSCMPCRGNMLAPNTQRGVQATTSRLFSKAKWCNLLQISSEQQHHGVQAPHGVSWAEHSCSNLAPIGRVACRRTLRTKAHAFHT